MFEKRYEKLQVDAAPRSRTELIGVDGIGELIVQVENIGTRALGAIEITFYANNRVAGTLTDFSTIGGMLLETQANAISTLAPGQWGVAYLDVRNASSVTIKLVASGSFDSYPKEETLVNLFVKGRDYNRPGSSNGSGEAPAIDYVTLGTEVANRIALKTLQVTGGTVDEASLATAIADQLAATSLQVTGETVDEVALATAIVDRFNAETLTIDDVAIGSFPPSSLDTDGNLKISKALAPSACISGDRAIANANQFENLSASTTLKSGVFIQAHEDNTGLLFVKAAASAGGPAFRKEDGAFFAIDDLVKIQIAVSVAGDRVRWWGS